MEVVRRVLSVSGSLRAASTNSAVLRTALHVAPKDVEVRFFEGLAGLPAFNPDLDADPLPPAVAALRHDMRISDALLLSTPEYAGGLPGSFKNLLDWLVGDEQPGSLYTKPVAWVNVAARGAAHAHESLRTVLGYVGADVIESACLAFPVTSDMVGEDGLVADTTVRAQLTQALETLARAATREGSSGAPRPEGPRR
jgi:chromate reductase, NAD(P)H dehydrogenase (quinone)